MNQTKPTKANEIARQWYEVDATGRSVGRLASLVAKYLIGKNNTNFVTNLDMGNFVVITNVDKVTFSGDKLSYTDLRHYTGYPSGLRKVKVSTEMKKKPENVILSAIKGMLPDSKLKDRYLTRLHLYTTSDHPHSAQQPVKLS